LLAGEWCKLGRGSIVYSDSRGGRHVAELSLVRDGSVWARFDADISAEDWTHTDDFESRVPLQLTFFDASVFNLIDSLNYTDQCVLTDIELRLGASSSWHPSYLTVYDPRRRETRTVLFRHNRDCSMATNVSLGYDKQGIVCDGGRRNACGQRGLPEKVYLCMLNK